MDVLNTDYLYMILRITFCGCQLECEFQQPARPILPRRLRACSGDISPHTPWYQYIIDFVLGQGLFNDTVLFYGRYNNDFVVGTTYSMPLAYLLVTFFIYAISVVLLVYK